MVAASSWPSEEEVDEVKEIVVKMSIEGDEKKENVKIVVSPYRICPLGAHIDHQGGTVSAMTINRGIILGFLPSNDTHVLLRSGQFQGEVNFRVDETQHPKSSGREVESTIWGCYARGAVYALQTAGYELTKGITGFINGSKGLDSSGLSSSAAAGIAYLLALESANDLTVSPEQNIELDRLIENGYLGLKNGILDQSAILLSKYGFLTCMNCKTHEHILVPSPKLHGNQHGETQKAYKILLAFSGLKHALQNNPGYNYRVSECQNAASILLCATGDQKSEHLLCNVDSSTFKDHKDKLEPTLARRAEHYFSENERVTQGFKAWASGDLKEFGKLISASGLSSIKNYECGCEPMIQLYEILLKAPGVFGARFSGAGFRGCCLAFVDADLAEDAASFVELEYRKIQPQLASELPHGRVALICEAGDSAKVL